MRFLLRLLFLGWVLGSLGACAGGGATPTRAEDPALTPVPDFLTAVLGGERALGYGDVVERLGPPVRIQAAALAQAPSDSLRKVYYYGLEVWLHEAGPGTQITRLALTDARHDTPVGLRVGYARPLVIRKLGRPVRETTTEMAYEQTEPIPVEMVLFFERRAISRIEWRFE